jgi:hypothetical protein
LDVPPLTLGFTFLCHLDQSNLVIVGQTLTTEVVGCHSLKTGPLVGLTVTLEVRSSLQNIGFF